jgi:tRNA pseudouridine55 synthase
VTEVDLGSLTSTGDPEGEVVAEQEPPTRDELEAGLERLRGEVELPIPTASAVKVGGERAYRLARRGIQVEMPSRRMQVHALEVIAYTGHVATLDLHVGSGTYVRAIAAALGGHCRTLRRTEVGPFRVEDADPDRMLAPAEALAFLPAVTVTAEEARGLRTGRQRGDDGVRYLLDGELVAVGRTVLP